MRWLDGITDSRSMSLSSLPVIEGDRAAWRARAEQRQNSFCKEAPATGGRWELPVPEAESEPRCRRAALSLGRGPPASCSCGHPGVVAASAWSLPLRSRGLSFSRVPSGCLLRGRSSVEQGPLPAPPLRAQPGVAASPAPCTRLTPLAQRGDKGHRAGPAEGPGLKPDLPAPSPPGRPSAPRSGPALPSMPQQTSASESGGCHGKRPQATWLNHRDGLSPGSGGQKGRVEGPAGPAASGGSEGGTFVQMLPGRRLRHSSSALSSYRVSSVHLFPIFLCLPLLRTLDGLQGSTERSPYLRGLN